uniref:Protein kinase domain-containing protein n=1 Tax=Trypanosoma vivax (strain Y486) TaxID=1055687 RepID=G0U1P6_TRYVY|nr:putative protein kinase [Trypanosoma vivax Y486]
MGSRHSGNSSGGCASSDQMASSRDTSDDLHESRSGRFSSGSQQQSVKPLSTGCVGAGSQILATFSHRNRLCANCDSEIRENTGGSYAHACLCIDCMYGEENALHDPTVDVPNSNLTFSRNLNSSLCPTECGSSSLFYDPCEACNRVIDDMEVVHRCDECRLFFCDDCYGEKGPAVHKHNLREFRRRMNSSVTDSSVVNKGRDREGNRLINDYVIIRVLGKGSNAKVSLVQHHRTGCFHALKILYRSRPGKGRLAFASKSTATDEDLLREIAVMRLVSHPNIVRLEEVIHDVESSKVYIIMEYCSKGPVHVHGSPPLPPEKVYKYGHGILAGLLHLHAQFLSHRDIKPANCLVNADDVVKIADFGTSGYQGHSAKVYGTPAYNCPEQFLGVHTSNEVLDSWAFAMTLYQLSHGTLPYPVHTLGGFRSQILAETPIPIDHCVGDQLEDLLHRMLEKDISKRMLASEAANHPFFFTCVERPLNLLPVADSTFDSSGEDLYERAQQMVIRGKNVGKCFHGMRSIQRMRRLLLNCEVELEGDWMTANHVGSAEVRGRRRHRTGD